VRRVERLGDVAGQPERLGQLDARAGEALPQVLALQPLHRQVERGGVPVSDVAHDAGVLELGEEPRFTEEALHVGLGASVQHLDRDARAALFVERSIDLTHAPRAGQLLEHEARTDDGARAGGEGHHHGRTRSPSSHLPRRSIADGSTSSAGPEPTGSVEDLGGPPSAELAPSAFSSGVTESMVWIAPEGAYPAPPRDVTR
jgi:hypothetical protein